MAPWPAGTARCMAWPRRRSKSAVSATEKAFAAARALYSPSECPATTAALSLSAMPPSACSTRSTASEVAISAGCAFSVRVSSSSGPSNMSLESFCFRISSTSSNTSRAARKGRGQIAAHADGLAALSRKNKGVNRHASSPKDPPAPKSGACALIAYPSRGAPSMSPALSQNWWLN